ncbi:hypothetical protein PoB_004038000 [Plakobranchus ocellatus]|uniref:Uncharacterized protein n=1 Tax=Plakobranchus ocellatus TaxID=259542 RepID=A0AAV4B470_9GAST|nr:hypothetical protein PoB_004038000 [Plakobranchus ocellatus]
MKVAADLVCARTKETEYFQTFIVGHVNCCFQCHTACIIAVQKDRAVALQLTTVVLTGVFVTCHAMIVRTFDDRSVRQHLFVYETSWQAHEEKNDKTGPTDSISKNAKMAF